MVHRIDFASEAFFRDPAAGVAALRAAGAIVETRFPIVGRVWVTTTLPLLGARKAESKTSMSPWLAAVRSPVQFAGYVTVHSPLSKEARGLCDDETPVT